jgi:hypothetical protein
MTDKLQPNTIQPFPDGQGGHYEENDNTSHLVTQLLPRNLPASHPLNPTSLPIRILNPTAPPGKYVKSEYAYIRSFVQKLWDEHEDEVDLVMHLGMADGWEWYTIERLAFNERFTSGWWPAFSRAQEGYYLFEDDAGKTIKDVGKLEGKGRWDAAPVGLQTKVDVDRAVADALKLVNAECGGADEAQMDISKDGPINMGANHNKDAVHVREKNEPSGPGSPKLTMSVRPHMEAGFYCCGFIYYESLATCWERKLNTPVIFTHVPGWKDPERLDRGAETICAIIGSVCSQIKQ